MTGGAKRTGTERGEGEKRKRETERQRETEREREREREREAYLPALLVLAKKWKVAVQIAAEHDV